ncbi:MAG: hypothetical protein HYV42_05485 [Candidatus Magasanikbacteria bacterium]|nr:hypothetical protein [Candidatus Magasanikbacteria bacterium]
MPQQKFATAINCMDGRTQLPVINWLREHYQVDAVDLITEPGPNKILAANTDRAAVESIRRRTAISARHHASRVIAIAGHQDCAGNPANQETQTRHTQAALKTVADWNFNLPLIGLWVNENWQVQEVHPAG